MERRPTASFEPMNDPDPRWVETTRAVQRDLDRSAAYQLAVREAELEDIMKGRLEAPPPTQYGWGKGMLGVQDGGGAIMDAQLVDATVEDVAQHASEKQPNAVTQPRRTRRVGTRRETSRPGLRASCARRSSSRQATKT